MNVGTIVLRGGSTPLTSAKAGRGSAPRGGRHRVGKFPGDREGAQSSPYKYGIRRFSGSADGRLTGSLAQLNLPLGNSPIRFVPDCTRRGST